MRRPSRRIRRFLVLLLTIIACLLAVALSQAGEPAAADEAIVVVQDYLESLSDTDLQTICHDRGLELAPRADGQDLQRIDYLEAARRCLSLEDEMNAILAANPELAAELEVEIDRMKREKERLEMEREEMLAEMALLQQQLEQAGIDLQAAGLVTTQDMMVQAVKSSNGTEPHVPQTAAQVFHESMVLLYERVRADVRFIAMVLRPVLTPMVGALKLLWRYAKPMVFGVVEKGMEQIKKLLQGGSQDTMGDDEKTDLDTAITDATQADAP